MTFSIISKCKSYFVGSKCQVSFSTSSPRPIHPLFYLVMKPLARVSSLILGRRIRRAWKALPDTKKETFKAKRPLIGLASVVMIAGYSAFEYYMHVEECKLSGRKRFIALKKDQVRKISEFNKEFLLLVHSDDVVNLNDPVYAKTANVVTRILNSNKDLSEIKDKDWSITVINDDEVNAFVLPNGHIFVYTGLYKICINEDLLAAVLSHEIAHSLLDHSAENLSYVSFFSKLLLIPMAIIWAYLPNDGIAIVAEWFMDKVSKIMLELPFSRLMESEADELGLQLATKACFDVRYFPVLWARFQKMNEEEKDEDPPQWLSTHPSHETREKTLAEKIPEALKRRSECNCRPLPLMDPYLAFKMKPPKEYVKVFI